MSNIGSNNIKRKQELMRRASEAHLAAVDAVSAYDQELREARSALESAIEAYNSKMEDAYAVLMDVEALGAYENLKNEVIEFVDNVSGELNTEFTDHSDKWQESDVGQAYSEWASEWDSFTFDDPLEFMLNSFAELEIPDTSENDVNSSESCPLTAALDALRDEEGV
jgi:hypothetical protein